MQVYSILDLKAGAFCTPFFLTNDNLARRAFGDAVLDSSTGVNKHPEDYNLYRIGEFDDNSGELIKIKCPEFLAKAVDFIATKEVAHGTDKKG